MTTQTVTVPNISCGHCTHTIEKELGELGGVERVQASENDKSVTVTWDENTTTWDEIRGLLEEINYAPA